MRAVLILSRAIAKGSLLALNIEIPSQVQTLECLGGGGGDKTDSEDTEIC